MNVVVASRSPGQTLEVRSPIEGNNHVVTTHLVIFWGQGTKSPIKLGVQWTIGLWASLSAFHPVRACGG